MMIIDATDLKLGRLATVAAKAALEGEEVTIINSEKAVITGNKDYIVRKYQARRERGGPHWGPFPPRMPDRFVRRTIRGMLPYKTPRGRDALKRVMCYIGNPHQLEAKSLDTAHISTSQTLRFMRVGAICELLGGKQ
ncbi:MAG: 50S ribosomal protein L13 [Candidatus Woesearchaeota archaeon]